MHFQPLPEQGHLLTYRSADRSDFDAIARLWLESWQSTGVTLSVTPTERANRLRIDAEVARGWCVTVATLAGTIVAFLALWPDTAILDQLFVAPPMQGKGIGLALLETAIAAMPNGFTLRVATENHGACRFYERAGLVRIETSRHPMLGHKVSIYRWAPN